MTLISEQIISPKDTVFIDKKVRANEVYVYRLQAIDKFQQVSPISALSKVIFLNKNKPLPPKELKIENNERFIKVSWAKSTHRDVSGYILLRSVGINQEAAAITPIIGKDTLVWVDSLQLKPRVTYVYYLKELNWSGMESRLSSPAFGKLTVKIPPSPINSLTGESNYSNGNKLFWRQPLDAYTSIVRLYRATYPDTSSFTKIYEELVSIGKYQYEDKQTEIGKLYRYVIRPVSADSVEGVNSSPVDLIRIPPPLQAPQQLSISENGNSLRIKWTPVIKQNVAGYLVYRWGYTSGEKKLTTQMLPKNTTQYEDTDIQAGETYYYWVKAIDDKGYEGLPSEKTKYEVLR
jgi:fibronectin type 3 domain-containing protein